MILSGHKRMLLRTIGWHVRVQELAQFVAVPFRKVKSPWAAAGFAVVLNLLYLWAIVSYVEFSELACLMLITGMSASLFVASASFAYRGLLRWFGYSLAIQVLLLATTAFQFHYSESLRAQGRWLLRSSSYKRQVFNQDRSQPGDLKHMEWDGWGWASSDTLVYLVNDPSDGLERAGHPGLPCPVWKIHRLEREWYSVVFFTDESWERSTNAKGALDSVYC